jgi:2-polyprenyl-3-methyl-5-hydroxy-6-metoxy-1,4-benzoquinol methylase
MNQIRDDRCPLCAGPGSLQIALELSPKPPLSDSIAFRWCEDCDLLYAERLDGAQYREFYKNTPHDSGHVAETDTSDSLHTIQAQLITKYLGPDFQGTCLDFGCGEGGLSERLSRMLPDSCFYGVDLRNSLRVGSPVEFLSDFDTTAVRFDLIILSHVAEHMIELSYISELAQRLAPGGTLYIEVPDPLGYCEYPRREFMYYFDRLHVNHFSQTALSRWIAACNLTVTARGTHQFGYRDGKYPAQFVFASNNTDAAAPLSPAPTLAQAFAVYRRDELARAKELRQSIIVEAAGRDLLVYGRGDNFFRACSPGGPLHQLPLKAILDRNADNLQANGSVDIVVPIVGLRQNPDAVVLIAVSGGAAEVIASVRKESRGRPVIMV